MPANATPGLCLSVLLAHLVQVRHLKNFNKHLWSVNFTLMEKEKHTRTQFIYLFLFICLFCFCLACQLLWNKQRFIDIWNALLQLYCLNCQWVSIFFSFRFAFCAMKRWIPSKVGKLHRCLVKPDTLELTDQCKEETELTLDDVVKAEPLDKALQQVSLTGPALRWILKLFFFFNPSKVGLTSSAGYFSIL